CADASGSQTTQARALPAKMEDHVLQPILLSLPLAQRMRLQQVIDPARLGGGSAHGIARRARVAERLALERLYPGAKGAQRTVFAMRVREIFALVHEAERHRRQDEPDVEQHDRVIDALNGLGVSNIIEMLLERARRVRDALRRR